MSAMMIAEHLASLSITAASHPSARRRLDLELAFHYCAPLPKDYSAWNSLQQAAWSRESDAKGQAIADKIRILDSKFGR